MSFCKKIKNTVDIIFEDNAQRTLAKCITDSVSITTKIRKKEKMTLTEGTNAIFGIQGVLHNEINQNQINRN